MPDLWDHILHWIYPMDCAECLRPARDRRLPFFCHSCWESIRPFDGPICPCCGGPFASPVALAHSPGHLCGNCRESPPAFECARSPYAYEGVLAHAIHLFKYRKCPSLASPLADLMLVWKDKIPPVDLVLAAASASEAFARTRIQPVPPACGSACNPPRPAVIVGSSSPSSCDPAADRTTSNRPSSERATSLCRTTSRRPARADGPAHR